MTAVAANTATDPSTDFPLRILCLPNLLPTTLPNPSPHVIATIPTVAAVQWSQKNTIITPMLTT